MEVIEFTESKEDYSQYEKNKLIVFVGRMGSGKSTAAQYLENNHCYDIVSFAAPIKKMFAALGLTRDQLYGMKKGEPSKILSGRTPRFGMQTLGTEWARDIMNKDFWTNLWEYHVDHIFQQVGAVVCDDCRFPNEIAVARKHNAIVIKITRDSQIIMHHGSENQIDELEYDYLIDNNSSVDYLYSKIEEILHNEKV